MKYTIQLIFALLVGLSMTVQAAKPLTFSLNRLDAGQVVTVTENSWKDKYLLLAIGYTSCPDICPTTLLDMREALHSMDQHAPDKVKQIQALFITIDPLTDALENITKYAAYFDSRIIGLRTENFAALDNLVEQLRASYGYLFNGQLVTPPHLPEGYTVMHSTFIYLYSPEGRLMDAYPYNMDGETLAKSIIRSLP